MDLPAGAISIDPAGRLLSSAMDVAQSRAGNSEFLASGAL